MTAEKNTLALGGFPIASLDANSLLQKIECCIDSSQQIVLFFANTNFIVKCQSELAPMLEKKCVIINDGVGLDIAAKIIHGKTFPENLNGTDFLPLLLKYLDAKAKVFLLGAKPGIALRAAKNIESECAAKVVGTADGYEEARDTQQLITRINDSNANIILVAMGNPNQEKWILDNYENLKPNLLVGVGAFLDFLAGGKPRAPTLIRRLRLEWLYRLSLEPSRLLRRYTLDIGIFLAICLRSGKKIGALTP
jgi:beta-1,4-glucosyltransferase